VTEEIERDREFTGKALRALAEQTETLVVQEERLDEMETALREIARRAHLAWTGSSDQVEAIFTDIEAIATMALVEKDKLTFDEAEAIGLDGTLRQGDRGYPRTLQGLDRNKLIELVKVYRNGPLG